MFELGRLKIPEGVKFVGEEMIWSMLGEDCCRYYQNVANELTT